MAAFVNEADPNDPFNTSKYPSYRVVQDPDPSEILMDIWFVHGLFGNRETTWTSEGNGAAGTFWPKLLGEDFPKARIVTYGYDASVIKFSKLWEGVDTSGLEDYGTSLAYDIRESRQERTGSNPKPELAVPIYFVGHSLGGLVIEQCLLSCLETDDSLHPIAKMTYGVMFMGTPHKGSHLATWARLLRRSFTVLVPLWKRNSNDKVLEVLEKKSEVCKGVQKHFQKEGKHGRLKHVKLFCFYETKAMGGIIVVPEESAVINSEHAAPIPENHRDMVKFHGKNDQGYKKVAAQFREWTKNLVRAEALVPKAVEEDEGSEVGGDGGRNKVGQKKSRGGGAFAQGARGIHLSSINGGVFNMQAIAVAGTQNDFRYNKGNIKYQEQADADDQWPSSDEWPSTDDDDDDDNDSNNDYKGDNDGEEQFDGANAI